LVFSRVGRLGGGRPSHGGEGAGPERVLDLLGAYYAPGNRLLVLGHDERGVAAALARQRGWAIVDVTSSRSGQNPSTRWPSERSDTAIADAVVLRDDMGSLPDALADLARARSALHLEGLLVVATRISSSPDDGDDLERRYLMTRDSVRAVLTRAGFDIVEFATSPRHLGVGRFGRAAARGELVVARPGHGAFSDRRRI
jgi:hypothetical protein